jgi:putative transposase
VSHGAVRVRLDVTDVQAGMLLRAAGARRFAWNWAVAKIKANAAQWAAEATYGIARADRVRPLTFFTLAELWTAEKLDVAPWAGEHSTWTFRYALRDAANAHQAFLAGRRRFPRFKSRHNDRARFTVRDGLALEAGRLRLAKYGWVRISSPCPQQAKVRRLLRRGHATLQHITVSRHSDGRWYAAVTYTREARVPVEPRAALAGRVVGVDRGVKTAAVVADADGRVVAQLPACRAPSAMGCGASATYSGRCPVRRRARRTVARPSPGSAARTPGPPRSAPTRCTASPRGWPGTTRSWSWRTWRPRP